MGRGLIEGMGAGARCAPDPGTRLAHAHPFLEGNGRTILTVYAELARRAGFHVLWEEIEKDLFLRTLTEELLRPGSAMDALVLPFVRPGALSVGRAAGGLDVNFRRE